MNEDTLALLVPFGFFLLVGMSLWMVLHFRNKQSLAIQETVRIALEKGMPLSPELIDQMGANNKPHPLKDVRRGIVWIAVAVGMALFGYCIPDPSNQAFSAILAIAALPLAIGLGYLAMHQFARNQVA
ncbi:DUF6249 domain-containing protein [Microbulbifer sp. CAU 1566]|uniref:DUF6249 domain-containing protein n=1 Tax=Microbulbifer sp. CAU 1566 TaxID=2933269 RepID=UPI00200523E4|nr:DUF6249 domain-containing protein [Microbulbifer sp. CAU 1566]MCK7598558.1 DUF6249 domain-containing protein [Microbulbifer sp. CAU 1566]